MKNALKLLSSHDQRQVKVCEVVIEHQLASELDRHQSRQRPHPKEVLHARPSISSAQKPVLLTQGLTFLTRFCFFFREQCPIQLFWVYRVFPHHV